MHGEAAKLPSRRRVPPFGRRGGRGAARGRRRRQSLWTSRHPAAPHPGAPCRRTGLARPSLSWSCSAEAEDKLPASGTVPGPPRAQRGQGDWKAPATCEGPRRPRSPLQQPSPELLMPPRPRVLTQPQGCAGAGRPVGAGQSRRRPWLGLHHDPELCWVTLGLHYLCRGF